MKVSAGDWNAQGVRARILTWLRHSGAPIIKAEPAELTSLAGVPMGPSQLALVELGNGQRFLVETREVYR